MSNILGSKMQNNGLTLDMLWPIAPLLYLCCKSTPFLHYSTMHCRTQNLLSRTTTCPVCHIAGVSHMRSPIVLPKTSYTLGGSWCGASFPSTNSSPNRIPERPQQMVWYSSLKGHGFHGTNIKPGHVNLLVHVNIDSSKHVIHPG